VVTEKFAKDDPQSLGSSPRMILKAWEWRKLQRILMERLVYQDNIRSGKVHGTSTEHVCFPRI